MIVIRNLTPLGNKIEAKRYISMLISAFTLSLKNIDLANL
jgi:hypothetical protein